MKAKNEKTYRKTSPKGKGTLSPKVKPKREKKGKAIPPVKSREERLKRQAKFQITDVKKYYDIGKLGYGGRSGEYWNAKQLIPYFKEFRRGALRLPDGYKYWDHKWLMEKYSLKGWEFGNWLSQEDRMNYVCSTGIALFDLKNLLKLSYSDIGQRGKLGITLGSRGKGGKAIAFFMPGDWIINMTRYRAYGNAGNYLRLPVPQNKKLRNFLYTGGVGAFGHEYGHALDYWIGGYFDRSRNSFSLSGGRSISRTIDLSLAKQDSPRGAMEKLMQMLIWEDYEKKILTAYYHRLYNETSGDYPIRRNEIFARAFEQWISYEMNRKKQMNSFLHFNKYGGPAYMDERLLKRIAPQMEKLLIQIRKAIK